MHAFCRHWGGAGLSAALEPHTRRGHWPRRVRCAQYRGNMATQLLENWHGGDVGQGPGSHSPRLNLVVDRPGRATTSPQPHPGASPCAHESPGPLRYGRDPTLRHIVIVVRMRACTPSAALLTSGSLRDCGSGAFSKPHGAYTNSTTGARTGAQLNGAHHDSAPLGVSPRPLSASWGEVCREERRDSVCTVSVVPMGLHHKNS